MKLPIVTQRLTISALTLLAFFWRVYRLDVQSYWIDEAWTIYFANLSPALLWQLLHTIELKPAFYYLAIKYWIELAGNGEFALRFFSASFGVVTVPLTYRLGKALGDDRLGLIAALLVTLSPYQIWHSQDARMYTIFTASSVVSMWAFVNCWRRGGLRWWLVYIAGTLWALITHFHGFLLIGIQGLFLLLTWRRHWRGYLKWGASLAVIFLLYLPTFITSAEMLQTYTNWIEQPTLGEAFIRSAVAYSVGEIVPRPTALLFAVVFCAVYGLGLIYAARRRWGMWRGSDMLALLLAYTIAPIIAAWLYGEIRTTAFHERYLIPVQIGFLLGVTAGILAIADGLPRALSRVSGPHSGIDRPMRDGTIAAPRLKWRGWGAAWLVLLLLIGLNSWVLYHYYFDPAYAKPNWRAVAQTITNFELPGDVILLTGDGGEHPFNYYYKGDLPVRYDFNLPPLTSPDYKKDKKGTADVPRIMSDLAAGYDRIWFTPYGDPIDPALESWLSRHTYPAWHRWIGRKQLALYDSSKRPLGRRVALNTTFDESLGGPTLIGAALPADSIAANDLLPLDLTWQTAAKLPADYQLSLRLVNHHGDIFTQNDWPPLTAAGPTSTWEPGQPLTDRRSLWLPPDTPPGTYALQLVVYDPASGQQLGQSVLIPDIPVRPAERVVPLEALSIPNFGQTPLGAVTLVGYVLPDSIQPGQEMWLWLYWQAQRPLEPHSTLRLSLKSGQDVITTDQPLAGSLGPLETWQPGQVRRAVYHLPTSPRLSGPSATFEIALKSSTGQIEAETPLAQVELETRPRQFDVPAIAYATDVVFGNSPKLSLLGYDLPATQFTPGETLSLTLYWQAIAEMDRSYIVFVQVLNSAGQIVAQVDLPPQAGAAPTTTWLPGEIITDAYTLPLSGLPPGDYRLITGLYDPATGERLSLTSGSSFVELPPITVK